MATVVFTRRAVVAFAALAAGGLGGCNTNPTAAVQPQAVSGFRIGNIAVNTAPLLAQSGDPTASLVQQALPGQLAQAFAAHMAPGDPAGATLSVRIDSVYLGGGGPADPDTMRGAATLSGGGVAARTTRLRATSTYIANPTDQALVEQALQGRVTALSQSFAYWLKRRWRL
jgi:hypothetical protein